MRVPKKAGVFPAVVILPPVGTPASWGSSLDDRVQLGVEVRGYNPHLPDAEAAKQAPARYAGQGLVQPDEKREDLWLFYAYCSMMRAYDILESLPQVDKSRIYITGASQGGGLSLALASLRPQNAGVVSAIPGLCRLDWRSTNGGGWGPGAPEGDQRERILKDLSYFDVCNLIPLIRSRAVIGIGLLDTHTPPHSAASAYYLLADDVIEKGLLANPWVGHGGWAELSEVLPGWISRDAEKITGN